MKLIDCQQGTPEWWMARKGIPTASEFHRIITPKTGKLSAQAEDYIAQLCADRCCSAAPEGVEAYSRAMENGIRTEPEARRFYELERDCEVTQVGFVTTDDGRFGCSPDGLVGTAGGLELKCPTMKVQVKYLLAGTLPDEYRCQVHGSLWVTGRPWWDFLSYCHGLPPLLLRVFPDEFTSQIGAALEEFWPRYQDAWRRLSELRGDHDASNENAA